MPFKYCCLGFGVFLEVRAKIFLVAGEGVVSVLAFVTQKKFSLIKNCFDISLVTLAIIISWVDSVHYKELEPVQ